MGLTCEFVIFSGAGRQIWISFFFFPVAIIFAYAEQLLAVVLYSV